MGCKDTETRLQLPAPQRRSRDVSVLRPDAMLLRNPSSAAAVPRGLNLRKTKFPRGRCQPRAGWFVPLLPLCLTRAVEPRSTPRAELGRVQLAGDTSHGTQRGSSRLLLWGGECAQSSPAWAQGGGTGSQWVPRAAWNPPPTLDQRAAAARLAGGVCTSVGG